MVDDANNHVEIAIAFQKYDKDAQLQLMIGIKAVMDALAQNLTSEQRIFVANWLLQRETARDSTITL